MKLNIKVGMKGEVKPSKQQDMRRCFGLLEHHKLGIGDSIIVKGYDRSSGTVIIKACNGFMKKCPEGDLRKVIRFYKMPD